MIAQTKPLKKHQSPPIRFRRQWLLSRRKSETVSSWCQLELGGGYILHYHHDLKVQFHREASRVVVLIGVAVHSAAPMQPSVEMLGELTHESIVTWLQCLVGNYVVIFGEAGFLYLYTDPAGLSGIYYSDKGAASTPALLSSNDERRQVRLNQKRRVNHGEFFPG